jgi:polysaccharide export outer membrane protein
MALSQARPFAAENPKPQLSLDFACRLGTDPVRPLSLQADIPRDFPERSAVPLISCSGHMALYRPEGASYTSAKASLLNVRCMKRSLVLIGVLGLLTGCAGREPIKSTSRLTVVDDAGELPAPGRSDLTAADRPALIGPLDTIEVFVLNVPELNREIQVDSSGRIAMPIAGTIDARGLTAEELSSAIAGALRARYVRAPEVTVNIKSSVSQVVTIDGQVMEPGLYPVTNQMTLMRAIASAKGLSEFAKQDDVVVLRTVNSKRMAGLYNIAAIRRGNYDDPAIYANDVIIVGDSPQRRLFRDFVSLAPLLASPLIAVLQ